MNMKEIKEILELMEAHGLNEFELEKNGVKVKLSKGPSGNFLVTPQAYSGHVMPSPAQAGSPAGVSAPAVDDANVQVVRSPMVGTFYTAPTPDKEPFVQKGQDVKVDDVLCIIEAMKLMNELKSEVSGKVIEILVTNGEPVEFDQPLFKIQKL
jgi:acetyl-CoA carboxylase biotin carboxyl carrier protein